MTVEIPSFHASYAIIPVVLVAIGASLFKPKSDYKPLQWGQYKSILKASRFDFWKDRFNLWTLRFLYYYSTQLTSASIFVFDTIAITALSVIRYENKLHPTLHDLDDGRQICDAFSGDIEREVRINVKSALRWTGQLQWLIIMYFFVKLLMATLFVNGGSTSITASVIFDTWLFVSAIWSSAIEGNLSFMARSKDFRDCYNGLDGIDAANDWFDDLESVITTLNDINICLWLMVSFSLPVGVFIDLVCQIFMEFKQMFEESHQERENAESAVELAGNGGVNSDEKDSFREDGGDDEEKKEDEDGVERTSKANLEAGGAATNNELAERVPTTSFVPSASNQEFQE